MNKSEQYYSYINRVCTKFNISRDAYKLLKNRATRLHRLLENDCNGYVDIYGNWDEVAQEKGKLKIDRAIKRIKEQCHELNIYCYIQTDPRGGTLYIYDKEINKTNYDKGYCIY